MNLLLCGLPISCALLCSQSLPAQMLVVDRGILTGSPARAPLGRTTGDGFVGDHFRIGAAGEVWIIETIRTWAKPGESPAHSVALGDLFESVTLFGGIEAPPPQPGQPPQPDCDCHNLMTIKSTRLAPGADQFQNVDLAVAASAADVRQVDFRNLSWSVPGGVDIQFGVMGVGRNRKQTWHTQAAAMADLHQLKLFDEKGGLDGPYTLDGEPAGSRTGLNVQVWGHRSVPVAIRSTAAAVEVVLRGDASFDPAKTDVGTLRFGQNGASPITSRLQNIDGHTALIARFRWQDIGAQTSNISVCLNGRLRDGVPFEGCSLLTRPK